MGAHHAQNKRIFEMWFACHTQEEIAEAEDIDQSVISDRAKDFMDFGKLSKNHKAAAEHDTDFDIPLYNIWTKNAKTNSVSHYGLSNASTAMISADCPIATPITHLRISCFVSAKSPLVARSLRDTAS